MPVAIAPSLSAPVAWNAKAGSWAAWYATLGWALVPIDLHQKGPRKKRWQLRENCAVPPDWQGNLGLAHAYSGTCAIDIDDLEQARAWLADQGVDLDALLAADDAVQIVSGRPGHGKLLYRLPAAMVSAKWVVDDHDVINFRCATRDGATVQDLLPPSRVQDRDYTWGGKGAWWSDQGTLWNIDTRRYEPVGVWMPPRVLPELPEALRRAWEGLLEQDRTVVETARVERVVADTDAGDLTRALLLIDPDVDRRTWVQIGMAFHAGGGDYETFDQWSAGGVKYGGSGDTAAVWNSFKDLAAGGIGPGTLFATAKEYGWHHRPSVEEMFGGLQEELAGITAPELEVEVVQEVDEVDAAVWEVLQAGLNEVLEERALEEVRGRLGTTKTTFKKVVKRLRGEMYAPPVRQGRVQVWDAGAGLGRLERALATLAQEPMGQCREVFSLAARYVWIAPEGLFHDRLTGATLTRAALDGTYQHLGYGIGEPTGADAKGPPPRPSDVVLNSFDCVRVDAQDYLPGTPAPVFEEKGVLYLNMWRHDGVKPVPGDIGPWQGLLEWLIKDPEQRRHFVQWQAHLLRYQGSKINHNILLGGAPRIGKDSILQPLLMGLGNRNHSTIGPDKLAEDWEDHIVGKKLVVVNELLFSGVGYRKIENRLKPYGAAPPERLMLRRFGKPPVEQRNLVQIVACSNYRQAAALETTRERWFCAWCDPVAPREEPGFYSEYYRWLEAGGAAAVVYYLLTQVDLQGFDSKGSAPSTEWTEHMVEATAGLDPLKEKVREMVEMRVAPFDKDLARASDCVQVLKAQFFDDPDVKVTTQTIARVFGELLYVSSGPRKIWDSENKFAVKLGVWAVRNFEKYRSAKTAAEWLKNDFS